MPDEKSSVEVTESATTTTSTSATPRQESLGRQLIELQKSNSQLEQELSSTQQMLEQARNSKDKLQNDFNSLQSQVASKTEENRALQALYSADVLPEYQEIMLSQAVSALASSGEKPAKEVMEGLRERYPAMFGARGNPTGAGATSSSTSPGAPASQAVSASDPNAFIQNLEGIANGTVRVS